jgi:hypothetical protein
MFGVYSVGSYGKCRVATVETPTLEVLDCEGLIYKRDSYVDDTDSTADVVVVRRKRDNTVQIVMERE